MWRLPFIFRAMLAVSLLTKAAAYAEVVHVSFEQIADIVRTNNKHVRGAQLFERAAASERGYLSRSYLPTVTVKAGQETYKTGSQNWRDEPLSALEAKFNIYRGGKDTLQDKLISKNAEMASIEAEQMLRFEISKARITFWQLVAQRETQAVLEKSLLLNQVQLQEANKRVHAGLAPSTDELEFRIHQVELEQELAKAALAGKSLELELAILLGYAEKAQIGTPNKVTHSHTNEFSDSEFMERSQLSLQSIQLKVAQAGLEREQNESWWLPSLDFYGSYGLYTFREREYETQSERMEGVLGLELSVDVFDGERNNVLANKKILEIAALEAEREQTLRELKAEFENAKAKVALSHKLIHRSEDALKMSSDYLKQTLTEYQNGVKNSPDVLSALEKDLNMQMRFIDLRLDYELARVALMGVLGK